MSASSTVFCNHCGAANDVQAAVCTVCGEPPAAPPQPKILMQRYLLLKQVGRGGFGAVYQAEDRQLGSRMVAIKEMSLVGLSQQEAQEATEAFKREALMLAGLMHPNLPRIYDHIAEDQHWYLIMDFIAGETLEDYLANQPGERLPLDEALKIILQLCSVLDYLHTRQPPIIFRDLKPANVMRAPDGQLYLIDFGIARHFKPGQAKDTIAFGSPGYAAPEQYGKAQTRPSADIYSLGTMLHQLLTGIDPSITPFCFEPLHLHGYSDQTALEALLSRMVEIDARRRIESIGEVRQALEQVIQHPNGPETAPPGSKKLVLSAGLEQEGHTVGFVHLLYSEHGGDVTCLGWSPDGMRIASGSKDGRVRIWDAMTGAGRATYYGHSTAKQWPTSLAWSPEGTRIATTDSSSSHIVHVLDAATGTLLFAYGGHKKAVRVAAWSPNGRYLASGSDDQTIHVWDAFNGNLILTYTGHMAHWPQKASINKLIWSPDSMRIASIAHDRTIRIWNAFNGVLQLLYIEHGWPVTSLTWSPDGQFIASAGSRHDATVQIWDTTRSSEEQILGRHLFTYHGHVGDRQWVQVVRWSPDGRHIASAGGGVDTTIHVWDAFSGQEPFIYRNHHEAVYALDWSPDAARIASGGAEEAIQVWQAI